MKRLALNGPQDYMAVLVRRKWWVIVPFITLSCAIAVLTYILPRMYVSDTLILIRPRDVPEEFVKNLLAGSTEQRLTAIEQTVLSRTNLIQILNEFADRLPEYRGLNMDEKVLKLRKQIQVTFEVEKKMGVQLPVTYFHISYQNGSPDLAQMICAKLTSLFIEQDNRAREVQVFGTTEFLSGELDKVAVQLQDSEAKLKSVKENRRYELPDQLETNLRTLDRLGLQKRTNAEALDRYATIRLNLERQISETPEVIDEQPQHSTTSQAPSGLVLEYRKKFVEYQELAGRYTEKHPDVQAARAQLEQLKKQIPPGELAEEDGKAKNGTVVSTPNPIHQNLVAQLQEVKTELDIREKERKWLESEVTLYEKRVASAPQSEQEIASIVRQNADLTKQHEDLKNKLAQAKLSESLESRQKGSQFVIVDPANYPLLPTKPVKWAIVLAGIAVSFPFGVAFAVGIDLLSGKIWTPMDLESMLSVPVLAEIPEIITSEDETNLKKRRATRRSVALACMLAYSLGLYLGCRPGGLDRCGHGDPTPLAGGDRPTTAAVCGLVHLLAGASATDGATRWPG